MPFTDSFLPEFEDEMKSTRLLLERVPMEKYDWKPHPKSTSLGALASHLVNLAGFGTGIVTQDEINFNPAGAPPRTPPQYRTRDELLAKFDANVKTTREAVATLTDDRLTTPWSLKNGNFTIFTRPRSGVLRTFMLNHIIHHRGQLGVYLRLNDVPLPSVYGPTADT